MATRKYVSSVRADAAAEKRTRVLTSAADLLRQTTSIADFSLDAVAKAAGVTRLTVYNQFGSRRGLLEAVFDEIARRGGLFRIEEAMKTAEPEAAIDRLIEIFCGFWSGDKAIGRLQDAMAADPEFAHAIGERNERRRKLFQHLVARIAGPRTTPRVRQDTADLLFALTSYPVFAALRRNRSADAVCELIKSSCRRSLDALE